MISSSSSSSSSSSLLVVLFLLIVSLLLCCCSGSSLILGKEKKNPNQLTISTTETDITTPIITPSTPLTPFTHTPNTPTNPTTIGATKPPQPVTGSWCVAIKSAKENALQTALDYACGLGGADCSTIQPNGTCYDPNTLRDHASFAFNDYYQKNPIPSSCNFGGTAVVVTVDPSYGECQYPSTNTSATVLNITSPKGSNIFSSRSPPPSSSSSTAILPCGLSRFFVAATCFICLLPRTNFVNFRQILYPFCKTILHLFDDIMVH